MTPSFQIMRFRHVGPESYDSDFEEFASMHDELIETSFQVVGTCNIIG
jgi:hypothetical protein